MQIEEFRARLEEFDEAINREHYLHYSGLKPSLETIRLYDEYSKLFSLETIRELQRQLEAADDGFYAADCLRAWIFDEITSRARAVPSLAIWLASRKAGMFLKEVWGTGQLYSADELGEEIGVGLLDPQVLMDELLTGLRQ